MDSYIVIKMVEIGADIYQRIEIEFVTLDGLVVACTIINHYRVILL